MFQIKGRFQIFEQVAFLRPCYTKQFFLQLATQRWRIKNFSSCRGGCQTFATFFATCNAYNNKQDGGNLPRAKDEPWLAHSDKIALQVAEGMLHARNLSRNVAKSRGSFYFSCNSQPSNCSCKMGVTLSNFSCNLQLTTSVGRFVCLYSELSAIGLGNKNIRTYIAFSFQNHVWSCLAKRFTLPSQLLPFVSA